jgi:hypothetical protein
MRAWWLLMIGALGGCDLYEAGALLHGPRAEWAQGRAMGCVDVSIEAILDPRVPPSSVVLDVAFGNHCDRPVAVDLSRLTVTAQWPGDPAPRPMEAYDPRHEIGRRTLGLRSQAREGIQFEPLGDAPADPPSRVCVLSGRIVAGQGDLAPVCFERVRRSMVPIAQEAP